MAASYPTLNSPTAFTLYSPTEVYAYGAESLEDGIISVLTRTRYNAAGSPLISLQKQLVSQHSDSSESKSIAVNKRNLTSAQWSVYNAATTTWGIVPPEKGNGQGSYFYSSEIKPSTTPEQYDEKPSWKPGNPNL